MSDDEDNYNAKSHKNLLQAISSLGKTQHIRKSTRSEPQPKQDEFRLVKGATSVIDSHESAPTNAVGINDLVQILKRTKKHVDTGKKLKNVQSTKRVLQKPLEKPEAERIKRTIGYEGVKKKLLRWDAVVAKNRSAETQVFPLQSETVYINTAAHAQPLRTTLKSELAQDLAAADAKLRALKRARMGDNENEDDLAQREKKMLERKLTRDELIARRKELAYLKMRESQKSAKARQKNKIKSKKYHKLLKRQKMLQQIKEFELQAKTNPEAALAKLNELEKSRVLERASLRHKNTGVWAKNLQVRAKYDKDVRKDLAEQLAVSRELTEKKNIEESDSDTEAIFDLDNKNKEQENAEHVAIDPFNPWTKTKTMDNSNDTAKDEQESNWRKYWLDRNDNNKKLEDYRKDIEADTTKEANDKVENVDIKPKKTSLKKKRKSGIIENGWLVEEIKISKTDKNIDDIFDAQEDKIRAKLSKKLKQLSQRAEKLKNNSKIKNQNNKNKLRKNALQNLEDLSFKNTKQRPNIDEELNHDDNDVEKPDSTINRKSILDVKDTSKQENVEEVNKEIPFITESIIDPNNVADIKLKHNLEGINGYNDAIDNVDMEEDVYDEFAERQLTIIEAFEDDDVIADFTREKTKDSELKQTELQLSMPGWGSWAGAGIVDNPEANKNKIANRNKRLLLKLAKEEKRRDENKDEVYINENATNKHLRTHLVSDVPFPFTSVQDYEASIRAPIGRNFVPETAFRMLTRPAVITRKGAIIEPMDESELVKQPRRLRHVVDQRIERTSNGTSGMKVK